VYKINCQDCSSFYIGKTYRHLETRMEEHLKDKESAVFQHAKNLQHQINWSDITILDSADTNQKLLIKEQLYINKFEPDLNIQSESRILKVFVIWNLAPNSQTLHIEKYILLLFIFLLYVWFYFYKNLFLKLSLYSLF